jgi:enoyl-CoA hydratase/carnithine racemase
VNVSLTIIDAVAWLTLERAEQKNAITLAMWRQIAGLAKEVASSSARALVLRGQSGCFCSGADLDELTNIDSIDAARNYWLGMKSALDGMAEIKIPKIAMIEKYCLGGGCILALTCDLRYATKETVFGIPVAKHGYMLDTATVARLTALIGPARTKELIFLANTISGDEALSVGLVNRLFEPNQIESELKGIITRITEANADSVKQIKAQVDRVVATMTADESTVKQDENMIVQQFLSRSRKP